jgi:hypothetical protein
MTMDDPGWGGYVPPSDQVPPPLPPQAPAPPRTPAPAPTATPTAERLAQSAATVGQQQVAKAGAWLAVPKNKKIAIGAAVVVVIVIIGAALGLGGGGGLSKAQYITKADAICTSFSPQLTSAESAGNVSQVVSIAQSELSQLQALGPPSQDPQGVTTWLNDEQAAVTALQQGNQTQFSSDVTKGSAAASAYGLQSCAG